MSGTAILTMVFILTTVIGGFIYFARLASRKEKGRTETNSGE